MTINGKRYGGRRLAFMFFAPPAAWGLQLLIGYGLVTVACLSGTKIAFEGLSLIVALITIVSGVTSFLSWHHRGIAELEVTPNADEFVAVVGVLLAVIFLVLIVGTALYGAALAACPPISMILP
ncbi:MAG TPA: hypothetical protein VHD90_12525 [Phototrophicaceae bacterium]|nr:hypothetical protein [Phototrophicaceae bacterium]